MVIIGSIEVEQAIGWAEHETALRLVDRELVGDRRITLGADRADRGRAKG
jgi:hypothetical protein